MGTEGLNCFVCDGLAVGRYFTLATCRTQTSKVRLIEKLGQLVGDKYMVVISEEDIICRGCASMMNTLDRLEKEMNSLRTVVLRYLEKKYELEEDELLKNSLPSQKNFGKLGDEDGFENQTTRKVIGRQKTTGQPFLVLTDNTLKVMLEFDLFDEKGNVRGLNDAVWKRIHERLNATKISSSLHQDVSENEICDVYCNEKNVFLESVCPDEEKNQEQDEILEPNETDVDGNINTHFTPSSAPSINTKKSVDKTSGPTVQPRSTRRKFPIETTVKVLLEFDLFDSKGKVKCRKDSVWVKIQNKLGKHKLPKSYYIEFAQNKHGIRDLYVKEKNLRVEKSDAKLLDVNESVEEKQAEEEQQQQRQIELNESVSNKTSDDTEEHNYTEKETVELHPIINVRSIRSFDNSLETPRARRSLISVHKLLEVMLEFDLFDSLGNLKRRKDIVWTKIKEKLNSDKKAMSFQMEVHLNRRGIRDLYLKEKNLYIEKYCKVPEPAENEIETMDDDQEEEEEENYNDCDEEVPRQIEYITDDIVFNVIIDSDKWKTIEPYEKEHDNGRKTLVLQRNWTQLIANLVWEHCQLPCCWIFKHHNIKQKQSETCLRMKAVCKDCKNLLKGVSIGGILRENNSPVIIKFTTSDSSYIPHTKKPRITNIKRTENIQVPSVEMTELRTVDPTEIACLNNIATETTEVLITYPVMTQPLVSDEFHQVVMI